MDAEGPFTSSKSNAIVAHSLGSSSSSIGLTGGATGGLDGAEGLAGGTDGLEVGGLLMTIVFLIRKQKQALLCKTRCPR